MGDESEELESESGFANVSGVWLSGGSSGRRRRGLTAVGSCHCFVHCLCQTHTGGLRWKGGGGRWRVVLVGGGVAIAVEFPVGW